MDEETKQRFEKLEDRVEQLEGKKRDGKKEAAAKPQSIQEFLAENLADGYTQKTTALGYYLEKFRNKSYFTSKDIEVIFREAREPVSKNIGTDVRRAIQNGWIMEHTGNDGGLTTYVTTNKAEKAIKAKFKEGDQK